MSDIEGLAYKYFPVDIEFDGFFDIDHNEIGRYYCKLALSELKKELNGATTSNN